VDNASGDPVYVPATIVTGAGPGGGGGCVTVPFTRAGLMANYTATVDGTTSTWETTTKSDAAAKLETRDVVRSPGAPVMTIDSVFDFDVANDVRAVRHAVSEAKTSAGGMAITIKTDMTFTPSMPTAPVPGTQWCVGRTWNVPAITTKVVVTGTFPGPTTIVNRAATTAEILANETLNTAAGPLETVKLRTINASSDDDVKWSLMWYSVAHGIFVRQENLSPGGSVVSTMEVTAIH
jgi:hypothetical protein